MSEPMEVEAKFDLDPGGRDVLLNVDAVGRFTVLNRTVAEQDDVYYDTEERALAEVGSTLRVRRTENATRMTYKGQRQVESSPDEAHLVTRLEDEVTLDGQLASRISPAVPLPDLGDITPLLRARAIVGAAPLHPVARLENKRATILLGDGDVTIEMAVDDCTGTRFRDQRVTHFEEVELEVRTGGRAALLEASNALVGLVPGLTPSRQTKLGRTLG